MSHESGGPILWSETFVRPVAEVDALREEMASKVGDVAICALGRTNSGARRFGAEAFRLLFAACEQKHAYDAAETTKLFRQLLILQPDFAHGWGMLAAGEQIALLSDPADTTALGAAAERDARHALELDPHEGEAYFALALAMPGNAQWLRRMDILTRGHALDPSNGELDNHIGNDLEDVGRWHEAESFHEQAVSADPFGVFKIGDLAFVRGFGDDPVGAVKTLMIGRKRFGKHRAIAWRDFQFHALLGDARHAQAILDDAGRGFEFQPQQFALWEGVIAARIAPSTRNDLERRRAIDGAMHAPQGNVRLIVELLARDHRIDDAFAFIERLPVEARNALPTEMLFESLTASLRADPRFMTLAARHGLVDIWQATGRWPDFCSDATRTYDCQVEAKRALSPDARSLVAAR